MILASSLVHYTKNKFEITELSQSNYKKKKSLWYGCKKLGQIDDNIHVEDKKLQVSVQEIIWTRKIMPQMKVKICERHCS